MKTSNWMKRFAAIAGSALVGLIFATSANADNPEPVTVNVEWVDPIAVSADVAMEFGLLDAAMAATETVTIATDGNYTESTAGNVVGGTTVAASLTITVGDSTAISIIAGNHQGAADYSLGLWTCNYESAGSTPCHVAYNLTSSGSSSSGDTLLMGATLTADGGATAGNDNSTFDVTVTYQ